MHRFKSYELLLGALLMLAAVTVAMVVHAQVAGSPDATGWPWLFKDAAGFFALCALLVAIAQAVFFVVQLRYMRAGIEHASNAANAAVDAARIARNAERPYFTPTAPELRNWKETVISNDEYGVLSVWFEIENVGKGVGFLERYAIAHEVTPRGGPVGTQPTDRSFGFRLPIRSDARWIGGAAYDHFQLSATERADLTSHAKTLHVYGHFEYSDLFSIRRRTGFIFEFVPEASTFVMLPHSFWTDVELPPVSA